MTLTISRPVRVLAGAGTALALLVLWQLLAGAAAGFTPIPAPAAIVAQIANDGPDFYLRALSVTAAAAAAGWLWGNVVAVLAAMTISIVGALRGPVLHAAVAVYCLPIVAIGPILQITLGGTSPQIVLAALSVYFPTLVATDAAMRSVGGPVGQLVAAFGGNRWDELIRLRWWFGLPGLFAGLKIAAPSAFLGALIGEYLGSESGLGVAMVSAQQSLQVERTWALALVGTLAAGLAYLATSLVARAVTGWAVESPSTSMSPPAPVRSTRFGAFGSAVGSGIFLLAAWQVLLWAFRIDPFIGWGPFAVIEYLTLDEDAAGHRAVLWEASVPTLAHTGVGLGAGAATAILAAACFSLFPPLSAVLFPIAMALRSVPLVALTPLIALTFGRGLLGVAVVTGIVTFFPTLTMLTTALAQTPTSVVRLGEAYGASRLTILVRLRFVNAVPVLFTALRTTAPLAVSGALLAEWLFTGNGLGNLMLTAQTGFRIGELWSAVVLVTLYSLALYGVIGLAEQLVHKYHDGTLTVRPRSTPRTVQLEGQR